MARSSMLDKLQSFRFMLADITPNLSLSTSAIPFLVFNPTMNFATVSEPTLTANTEDVVQLNSLTPRTVVTGHKPAPITAARGATFYEGDLHRWFSRAQHGYGVPRRDLLLIQYMFTGGDITSLRGALATAGIAAVGLAAGASTGNWYGVGALAATAASQKAIEGGPVRVPGRAWILRDCIPTEYRAASTFDAKNSEVSIEQLQFNPSFIDQISIGD